MNSLAEQVVNLFLLRAVLDNCLCSAKHSGLCSTSSCEHQDDEFLLCLNHGVFCLSIQQCFGEQKGKAGLRLRSSCR